MKTLNFQIELPSDNPLDEKEHFFLTQNGQTEKIFLHDYTAMYHHPGLYEYICYQHLAYQAPQVLSSFFIEQVKSASDLTILDIGAGSGLTARELKRLGVNFITGVDIYPEAAEAVKRESPDIYENYYVEDLSQLKPETAQTLKSKYFNSLVCCSAMPVLPASVFLAALNLVAPNAYIAFNVRKDIWQDSSAKGFAQLHPWINDSKVFELHTKHFFVRRNTTFGQPIEDVAIFGIKKSQ